MKPKLKIKSIIGLCVTALIAGICVRGILCLLSRDFYFSGQATENGVTEDAEAHIKMKWFRSVIFKDIDGELTVENSDGESLAEYRISGKVLMYRDGIRYAAAAAYDAGKNCYISIELYYDSHMEAVYISADGMEFCSSEFDRTIPCAGN